MSPFWGADAFQVPGFRSFIALLIAAGCGYAMLRHSRRMLFDGVSLSDGGGWTAVILGEFTIALGALAIASY